MSRNGGAIILCRDEELCQDLWVTSWWRPLLQHVQRRPLTTRPLFHRGAACKAWLMVYDSQAELREMKE
eukprot:2365923-Amphidinium_carterae.1